MNLINIFKYRCFKYKLMYSWNTFEESFVEINTNKKIDIKILIDLFIQL